jgi:hypothetical protein
MSESCKRRYTKRTNKKRKCKGGLIAVVPPNKRQKDRQQRSNDLSQKLQKKLSYLPQHLQKCARGDLRCRARHSRVQVTEGAGQGLDDRPLESRTGEGVS